MELLIDTYIEVLKEVQSILMSSVLYLTSLAVHQIEQNIPSFEEPGGKTQVDEHSAENRSGTPDSMATVREWVEEKAKLVSTGITANGIKN